MKKAFLISCICALMAGTLAAQRIDSLMMWYNKQVPQEKIHVQFDNTKYTPGQTIWFKAYLMTGNETSKLSKNFYIDWYDAKGKLISRVVEPVVYASAAGSFTIPEKYAGNELQAVAYTRWMLNFDSAFLFRKKIPVVQQKAGNLLSLGIPTLTIDFFPEGGDLVEKLTSVVAFRAMNTAGEPVSVDGIVKDKAGQTVTTFKTRHDGMGTFKLLPLPGETYTAEWKDITGTVRTKQLPPAKKEGLVLGLDEVNPDRSFHVERSEPLSPALQKVTIVASINQEVVYQATASMADKKRITAKLPTLQFPSGVLQLTVLDAEHQPLAERVLFVNNYEYRFDASVNFDTLNFNKRGKNTYEINIPDSIQANLSMAVTDGESGTDSANNIISQLLLSSEIKGRVNNPAYYFSSTEDSVANELDLVMLTNGWRRFKWKDVWSKTIPALKYPVEKGYLSIAGKIDNLKDSKIKKAQFLNLILMAKDSSRQFIFTPLQADGSFEENNLILFDTATVFYQLNGTTLPGRSKVNIKNNFVQPDSTRLLPPVPPFFLTDTAGIAHINYLNAEQKRLDELRKRATLQEVTVKTKVKSQLQLMDEKYTSGMFQGEGSGYQFNMLSDPSAAAYQSVLSYLQSRVAGLMINNPNSMEATASWRGSSTSYFIDEMPADAERINMMPMSDVAYIKVFRPPFMGAPLGGAGGAIAVYTKRGDDAKSTYSQLERAALPGYTLVKEFYHPNYAESQAVYTNEDFRRTLYWKPFIVTDGSTQKVKLSFYNNDISSTFQLVLEGVTSDGRLVHISKLLK